MHRKSVVSVVCAVALLVASVPPASGFGNSNSNTGTGEEAGIGTLVVLGVLALAGIGLSVWLTTRDKEKANKNKNQNAKAELFIRSHGDDLLLAINAGGGPAFADLARFLQVPPDARSCFGLSVRSQRQRLVPLLSPSKLTPDRAGQFMARAAAISTFCQPKELPPRLGRTDR